MNTNRLTIKLLLIGLLVMILIIPKKMVERLIGERQDTRREVANELADKWGSDQEVGTPYLVIPYRTSAKDTTRHYLSILPQTWTIQFNSQPQNRGRGIHQTILFRGKMHVEGHFDSDPIRKLLEQQQLIDWDEVYLYLSVKDRRGLTAPVWVEMQHKRYSMYEVATDKIPSYESDYGLNDEDRTDLISPISLSRADGMQDQLNFRMGLDLCGQREFKIFSAARHTVYDMEASWPTVAYLGSRLPSSNQTSEGVASAHWDYFLQPTVDPNQLSQAYRIVESELACNSDSRETRNEKTLRNYTHFGYVQGEELEVSFKSRIDHYHMLLRASKYGILFIVLTFVVFFFVELLYRKQIHPIQYLLVGFALLLFYTLLLSLSEHVSFSLAYIVSSVSIISLITLYAKAITNSLRVAFTLLISLVALYIFLYVVLQLEELALLLGSLVIYTVLALCMYCSRKVNWFELK